MKYRFLVILVVCCLISFGVGYGTGFSQAVDWGLEVAFKLVEQQKINITIDETMIKTGIMQYKDNIGGCLFLEDALVLYESWNQTRPG